MTDEQTEKDYERTLNKIKKKFILTNKEVKIYEFFKSIKCNICGSFPTKLNKNYKTGKDIFCEDCYKMLMENQNDRRTNKTI